MPPNSPVLNALTTRFWESYTSVSMSQQSRLKKSSSDWLISGNALRDMHIPHKYTDNIQWHFHLLYHPHQSADGHRHLCNRNLLITSMCANSGCNQVQCSHRNWMGYSPRNWVMGQSPPPRGPGAKPLVRGSWGETPWSWKLFSTGMFLVLFVTYYRLQ